MNDPLAAVARFILRLLLIAAGLVFAASLLLALLVLLLAWTLRALWATLTGKPVTPFVMRVNPRAGFTRFYRRGPSPEQAGRPGAAAPRRQLNDVTDVEPKEPGGSGEPR